jgi:hypothetical protein
MTITFKFILVILSQLSTFVQGTLISPPTGVTVKASALMPRLTPDEVRMKLFSKDFETLASDDDPQVNGLYRSALS